MLCFRLRMQAAQTALFLFLALNLTLLVNAQHEIHAEAVALHYDLQPGTLDDPDLLDAHIKHVIAELV